MGNAINVYGNARMHLIGGAQDARLYIRIRYRRKAIAVSLFQLAYLYTNMYIWCIYLAHDWPTIRLR